MKNEINMETINKLSNLSKIEFSEEEKEVLLVQVNDIISMLDKCGDVDIINKAENRKLNISDLRNDDVKQSMTATDVFINAPRNENGYFVVPKVVD